MHMTSEVRDLLFQFQILRRAAVDASALIYMKKAGFLEPASDAIDFFSTRRVLEETGYTGLNVRLPESEAAGHTADQELLNMANRMGIPLISEDRRLLLSADKIGMTYFNSILILHYLFFRGRLNGSEHLECKNRLLLHAWYGPEVVAFSNKIEEVIRNPDLSTIRHSI